MAQKTQTKTEIRNSTAKIGKLLRGIDNESLAIRRDQDKLNIRVKSMQDSAKAVQTLVGGISNTALSNPQAKPSMAAKKPEKKPVMKAAKPKAAKPAKPIKAKPVMKAKLAKVAKTAKVKAAKPAKVAKAAKPAAKAAKVKTESKKVEKTPSNNRPPLKKVIVDIITKHGGKPMGAAEIYKEACQKHGYYSRQSLYNALKDLKSFAKNGEGYQVVESQTSSKSSISDSEAENFVRKVDEDSATSAVS